MPKILTAADRRLAACEEHTRGFQDRQAWQRSSRGNLTREFRGCRVTIFQQGDVFAWCIAKQGREPRFSSWPYTTEGEAQDGAEMELWKRAGFLE